MSFHDWGRVWQIHPQRVVTRGTVGHREERLGLRPGEYGPPVGFVEARTGAVVELPNRSRIANLFALEYTGALSRETKWLQFVWFEMTAVTPSGTARLSGSIPTTSGTLPFTTDPSRPSWAVDSGPSDPFYESGALAIRSSGATTIFDRPGGSSVAPLAQAVFSAPGIRASSVTFTAHFDTYLVQRDVAMYHVPWAAGTTFTLAANGSLVTGPVTYGLGAVGNVSGLPADLRALLHARYSAFRHVR
jgi:hypothetical protein